MNGYCLDSEVHQQILSVVNYYWIHFKINEYEYNLAPIKSCILNALKHNVHGSKLTWILQEIPVPASEFALDRPPTLYTEKTSNSVIKKVWFLT